MGNLKLESAAASPSGESYDIAESRKKAPGWARFLYWCFEYFTEYGGGPKIITMQWAVNLQKIATGIITYGMMVYYDNYSTAAWVYLGLHGIYGYTWIIKDLAYPNPSFSEKRMTIFGFVYLYVGIACYWLLPWLLIARHIDPPGFIVFLSIALCMLGVTFMATADVQKNLLIRHKKGLITGGVFAYTRNPNYLGEIMIYSSFALMASHWIAWVIVIYATVIIFLPRMVVKDASISRHPGWAEYKAKSGLIIPWAFFNGRAIRDLLTK